MGGVLTFSASTVVASPPVFTASLVAVPSCDTWYSLLSVTAVTVRSPFISDADKPPVASAPAITTVSPTFFSWSASIIPKTFPDASILRLGKNIAMSSVTSTTTVPSLFT